MKYLIFPFLLLSLNAFAADETGITVVGDPEIGAFAIHSTENMEPVWHQLLLTIAVKCRGEKQAREIKRVKVCKIRSHKFDQSTKNLMVQYNLADTTQIADTPCTRQKKTKLFNLSEECGFKGN